MLVTQEKSDGKPWYVQQADSLGDFVSYVSGKSEWKSLSSRTGSKDFTGSGSWEEAIALASEGWPEGRRLMSNAVDAAKLLQHGATVKTEAFDVAGSFPLVPRYIAGAPDCMVTHGLETARTRPIIRFIVSHSASGGVETKTIRTRGAAILSWLDQLEANDCRVEVLTVMTSQTSAGVISSIATLKRADEPLELDRMAFALCHPSFLRRLTFAAMEMLPQCEAAWTGDYGMPSNKVPGALDVPHSVYFPAGQLWNGSGSDMASALAAVEAVIREGLGHADAAQAFGDRED